MRPFEILISALIALYLVWFAPRPLGVQLAPALALLFIFTHFFLEGYRWQMIPLYALTLTLAALTFFKVDLHPVSAYSTLIVLAVGIALPALFPVPKIPEPNGKYQVGTDLYEVRDSSRAELYSGKDEARRFIIQAWYPAEVKSTDVQAQWMSNAEVFAPAISNFIGMPPFFLDHLALVDIPAYTNAQMASAEKPFPLILFSHGWKGFSAQNTGQALELASRGYIVIAPQHTYGAVVTVFPDGSIAPNNPNALPGDDYDPNYEVIARKLVNQWAGDLTFVLDQLEDAGSETGAFFNPHIDFSRIGAYGHSTGGGAAIQFCGTDARCKAVLGMDPFMRPVLENVISGGVSQPSFFMFSQAWIDDTTSRNNELFHQFIPKATNNFGVIEILGTKHYDFSDLPMLSSIAPQLGLKGPLNGKRVVEITNAYLLDFFGATLKDTPSKLFEGASPFKEVKSLK